jgi:hypothetical protein
MDAVELVVDSASSKVTFLMEAPIEKISGEAPGSVEGKLSLDPADVAKSSGLIKVDLDKLTLYQQRRSDEQSEFGERKKSDRQNEHARGWLEIGEDAPADIRQANRFAEFRINELQDVSAKLMELSGAERKLNATAVGDVRLHGRKLAKRAKVELTVTFDGDKPKSVRVRSLEPLVLGLEDFDVRPREAFGKLAQATLQSLGSKVAVAAPIEVDFTASVK